MGCGEQEYQKALVDLQQVVEQTDGQGTRFVVVVFACVLCCFFFLTFIGFRFWFGLIWFDLILIDLMVGCHTNQITRRRCGTSAPTGGSRKRKRPANILKISRFGCFISLYFPSHSFSFFLYFFCVGSAILFCFFYLTFFLPLVCYCL